jgi:hypothetical protein
MSSRDNTPTTRAHAPDARFHPHPPLSSDAARCTVAYLRARHLARCVVRNAVLHPDISAPRCKFVRPHMPRSPVTGSIDVIGNSKSDVSDRAQEVP